MRFYGITVDDYNSILAFQDGVCAVCLLPPLDKPLQVEHDHKTGEITGLVHNRCNTVVVEAVRMMRADPEMFARTLRLIIVQPGGSKL